MKLVTLDNGTRDGQLHVAVTQGDPSTWRVTPADGVPTLQAALEAWDKSAPKLQAAEDTLLADQNAGAPFDVASACAPLPRAVQWLDGSAFETHMRLMQEAWSLPVTGLSERPLMYQGLSDRFLRPTEPAVFPSVADGIDFEGEFGVILGDVPMGTKAQDAAQYIRLIVLINDWSLRALGPIEMATGFGWLQCKPACCVAPFAVTPDELGDAWRDARVCLPLMVARNGTVFGEANGQEMKFGFDELIAHAAYSRDLPAGTIIGSGTVANADYAEVGSSCITERRAIEQIATGTAETGFLGPGEVVSMSAAHGTYGDIFGTLAQEVRILGER